MSETPVIDREFNRCEGMHPSGGECGMRETCARFTQLAKDRKADPETYTGANVLNTCMVEHEARPKGYVVDLEAYERACERAMSLRRFLRKKPSTLRQAYRGGQ